MWVPDGPMDPRVPELDVGYLLVIWSLARWRFYPNEIRGKIWDENRTKWVMFSIAMLNYLRVSIDDNRCVCIGWFSTARLECRRIETSESRKSPQFQHLDVFFNSGWLNFLSTPGRTNGSYLWDGWFHHDPGPSCADYSCCISKVVNPHSCVVINTLCLFGCNSRALIMVTLLHVPYFDWF